MKWLGIGRLASFRCALLALLLGACGGVPDESTEGEAVAEVSQATSWLDIPALSCDSSPPILRWPLDGENGLDWFCNKLVDVDGKSGKQADYTGRVGAKARTYDGHDGIDMTLPTFRRMDDGSAVVRAAAYGEVVEVEDGHTDRQQDNDDDCGFEPNYVVIEHAGGYRTKYVHLKRNSIKVVEHQLVQTGTVIAVAGSSGCSGRAHLHFELQGCNSPRKTLDPFQLGLWTKPPVYEPKSQVMDIVLHPGAGLSEEEIIDPDPDLLAYEKGAKITVGVSLTSKPGDTLEWRLLDPGGKQYRSTEYAFDAEKDGNYMKARVADRWFTLGTTTGIWKVQILLNGEVGMTRSIDVFDLGEYHRKPFPLP